MFAGFFGILQGIVALVNNEFYLADHLLRRIRYLGRNSARSRPEQQVAAVGGPMVKVLAADAGAAVMRGYHFAPPG